MLVYTLGILCALTILFSVWRWYQYSCIPFKRHSTNDTKYPSVSIVLAVKNEENNLVEWANSILMQDYDPFEIIVVNDHSTDGTAELLEQLSKTCDRLMIYTLPTDEKGKKAALEYGIGKSRSQWILLTDADCRPETDQWIRSMMETGASDQVIIGISPYRLMQNSFVEQLMCYESVMIALDYISAAQNQQAYMAVGRNLAFLRSSFDRVAGFSSHHDLASGSDDLFIQSIEAPEFIAVNTDLNSLMWSYPKSSWSAYLQQKKRHLTTSVRYRRLSQIRLLIHAASHFGLYVLPILLAFQHGNGWFLWLIPAWLIAKAYILKAQFVSLRLSTLLPRIGYLDFSLLIFYLILALSNKHNQDQW